MIHEMSPLRNPERLALNFLRLLRTNALPRGLRFGAAASCENFAAMRGLNVGSVIDAGAGIGWCSLLLLGWPSKAGIDAQGSRVAGRGAMARRICDGDLPPDLRTKFPAQ